MNIIGANSAVNININNPKSPSINNEFISLINNQVKKNYQRDRENLNLFLIHHKPWPDTDDSLKEDGEDLLMRLSQYNDTFILCGHRHDGCSNIHTFSPRSDKIFLYSISPTPTLIDRKPNSQRGFNFIKLKRKKDKVRSVEINTFNHKGGVKFDSTDKKLYLRKDKFWYFKDTR